MSLGFAYRGAAGFLAAVKGRLEACDCRLVSEPAAASAVMTFYTTNRELEEAYFGDEGFVSTMEAGSLLIDLSPATPSFARDINAVATVSDLVMVTAPLGVRDLAAADPFNPENLMLFVAGEGDGVERAMPLLQTISHRIQVKRNAVEAQLARAQLSLQTAALALSAVESVALAQALSRSVLGVKVDDSSTQEAACDLTSAMMEAIRDEVFHGPFTVEMMLAQLAATLMAADDVDLILPQAEAAQHLLELLAIIGGSDLAPAALALVYGDEKAATQQGLDWSRAEAAFGGQPDDDDDGFPYAMTYDDDSGVEDFSDYDGPDAFEYSSN